MMKQANTYKGYYPYGAQSEFDHRYACWAKMKKATKRLAKRRKKRKERENLDENGTRYHERK